MMSGEQLRINQVSAACGQNRCVQCSFMEPGRDSKCEVCHRNFTDTALSFSMTILNAVIDLVSFSEILYSIYPPLFVVLVVYSVGGTAISIKLGQKLVGLNFQQEAQEANYRWALQDILQHTALCKQMSETLCKLLCMSYSHLGTHTFLPSK